MSEKKGSSLRLCGFSEAGVKKKSNEWRATSNEKKAMSNEQRVMNRGEKKSWRLFGLSEVGMKKAIIDRNAHTKYFH